MREIPPPRKPKQPEQLPVLEQRRGIVAELSAEGFTNRAIADVLGVHHDTVAQDKLALAGGNPPLEENDQGGSADAMAEIRHAHKLRPKQPAKPPVMIISRKPKSAARREPRQIRHVGLQRLASPYNKTSGARRLRYAQGLLFADLFQGRAFSDEPG